MNHLDYLQRINYSGGLEPSLKVLKELQQAHLMSVPFENLDIHYGRNIELNLDKIFNKVVVDQRGGFCYELNGLFGELLSMLGFSIKRVSARVYTPENGYGFEYDHLVTVVNIDEEEYLTDVGFGAFADCPLHLELNMEQSDSANIFIITDIENNYLQVNRLDKGVRVPEYIFKNIPRNYQEFANMCNYHQHSPDSHFTKNKLITQATSLGRKTLTDKKMKIIEGAQAYETLIDGEDQFLALLLSEFGIDML